MADGFGNSCVRSIFLLVNFLICVLGACIFGFSLWANLDKNFGTNFAELVRKVYGSTDHQHIDEIAKYQASLWILVGVGALLFVVGFLGCCGACCNSSILLGFFFFIILILTVIELGATIFAMSNKEKFVSSIQEVLQKTSTNDELLKNLQPIQDIFHCCGATDNTKDKYIKQGLCPGEKKNLPDCYDTISHMVESSGEIIIIIGFSLLAVEILSLIFSCLLCRSSREVRYSGYYS